ncbi:hypothetical protein LRH25_10650 [Ideonella azotifigens]|uniref:Phage baseplate protein n=1 Tax=Ideonella azotifigens TaxID=513160 RepID=A0ABN1KEC0_9BURK|nr:phage baseplate protein [Ideonella azotifigens]MCD2340804.1 hypothetical protein [Ideonella azotifigens]
MSLDHAHGALSAQSVLHTWEQAQAMAPLRRSLALLRLAWPEVTPGEWGALPIGARDARLFALFEALFGATLDTLVDCPACGEALELSLRTTDLRPEPAGEPAPQPLQCEGYELAYRLPCSDDLAALQGSGNASTAVQQLIERCVLQARLAGRVVNAAELPPAVIERLQQDMALRDPGADIRVALSCPACAHGFERRFDIGDYLWEELDDWAERTLAEVHTLASAYGWSEPQVLSLSADRRRRYIALVQGLVVPT